MQGGKGNFSEIGDVMLIRESLGMGTFASRFHGLFMNVLFMR